MLGNDSGTSGGVGRIHSANIALESPVAELDQEAFAPGRHRRRIAVGVLPTVATRIMPEAALAYAAAVPGGGLGVTVQVSDAVWFISRGVVEVELALGTLAALDLAGLPGASGPVGLTRLADRAGTRTAVPDARIARRRRAPRRGERSVSAFGRAGSSRPSHA